SSTNNSASVSASGGAAPYTYAWSNGGTTSTISGLANGTYTVTVTDSRSCTATCSATVPPCTVPATPGPISGNVGVCTRPSTFTYSIAAVPGATSYLWTAPANATIASGQGTTTVTVTFNNSFVNGTLSVQASNACGTSAASTL